MLNEQFFFTSPVQVVKVTPQNLEEVAEWCGGEIFETESRRKPGSGIMDKYVWVPIPEGGKIGMAFPGMYITKRVVATTKGELKVTWAVFARGYFEKNYFETPVEAIDATWGKKEPKIVQPAVQKHEPAVINVYVNNGMTPERLAQELVNQGVPEEHAKGVAEEGSFTQEELPKLGEHDGRVKMEDIIRRDAAL